MPIGKQTGIGPAVRALRHLIDRRSYYQLKFSSGEQALVLIAGMPAPSVEVVRLAVGGLVPWQTIWEYNPIRAGGYSDYIHKLKAMFSPATGRADDSVHCIRDALLSCESIEDARALLLQRERLANTSANQISDGLTTSNPHSAPNNDGWELGFRDFQNGLSVLTAKPPVTSQKQPEPDYAKSEPFHAERSEQTSVPAIPHRYRIIQDGETRVLTCIEAPAITVRLERKLSITAKQARKFPAGTIFLDGAAQGDPFIDVEKALYNLDHHQGCIGSMATCEQAMILIRKGLDLGKRDWVVLANNADLDTILALWVVLNHLRLKDDSKARATIMPILRLEGVVDAHGIELRDLSGLPPDLLHSTSATLKTLRQQEVVLKEYGRWSETDLLEYVAERLRALDELIYAPEDFSGLPEIELLARAEIADGCVAVACRSNGDIVEVQRQLERVYGTRLGILIVENGPSAYSVRRIDANVAATLERIYERLNLLDPAVSNGSENRWSGSADIGASPRKSGTGLTPAQIIDAVREAWWKPNLLDVLAQLPGAVFFAGALLPALALILIGNLLRGRGYIAGGTVLLSAVVLAITAGILFVPKARQIPGLYGWRVPVGFGWLSMVPASLIGAAVGGIWTHGSLASWMGHGNSSQFTGAAALLLGLGAELLFRGVIYGQLAARLPIQKTGGSLSWPTVISSALYAAASLLLFLCATSGEIRIIQSLLIVTGAVIFGISSAMARERSESILASVLLHWVCAAALLLSYRLLP